MATKTRDSPSRRRRPPGAMAARRPRDRQPGRCRAIPWPGQRSRRWRSAPRSPAPAEAARRLVLRWLRSCRSRLDAGFSRLPDADNGFANLGASFPWLMDADGCDDAAFGSADDPHLLRSPTLPAPRARRRYTRLVLIAGYLMVWWPPLAFAGVGVLVQSRAGCPSPAAIAALGIAGLYQFSNFKEACLVRAASLRHPVLALGNRRCASCARCRTGRLVPRRLQALMLVMFAVGTMNIFW